MKNNTKFWLLTIIVSVSGLSQGLLLPLISIIFEEQGISSSINGIHATGIYIGVLLISPFIEAPLHKFGYKPIILLGSFLVAVSLFLFPLWFNLIFWFILRLFIGIGDHMLHFSSQTWVAAMTDPKSRGKNMALYGLFFSLGFAIGPQLVNLSYLNVAVPFYFSGVLVVIAWSLIWLLRNEFVAQNDNIRKISFFGSLKRFFVVGKIAWIAMIPPFLYGVLETALNATFPIVALRGGFTTYMITIIISAFSVGTILFQVPIGVFSDRVGRAKILPIMIFLGGILFFCAAFIKIFALFIILFFVLGILLGSLYSLGLSYMTDLTPLELLPAGNILVGMCFSMGSIIGPTLTGSVIAWFSDWLFYGVVSLLLLFGSLSIFIWRNQMKKING